MLTVNGDRDEVERQLAGGELACPSCGGVPVVRRGAGVPGGRGNGRLRPVRVVQGPDAEVVSGAAAAALESWWVTLGRIRYPDATRLLVTADSGGSGAARSRARKKHRAAFAERHRLDVTLLQYPSGTSKWNKVEHRLFSFISVNWRGKPLASYETVLEPLPLTFQSLVVLC